jgi:YHS domain-containing protein
MQAALPNQVGSTVRVKVEMNFIARVFRFLFWLLVVSWSVALLKRLVGWMLRKATEGQESTSQHEPEISKMSGGAVGVSRRLVRDPVCGAHVAEVLAIPLREGGELMHFCSTQCRDQYLLTNSEAGVKKIAANG